MITVHIGLPRTASTYLQEKIFKYTHEIKYLPTTLDGDFARDSLLSGNDDTIKELINLIQENQKAKSEKNVIISAEDLSTKLKKNKKTSIIRNIFDQTKREYNIEKNSSYDFVIEETQIIYSLKVANKFYKSITGNNLKVVLGIRNQEKLLSSDYSANIRNRLRSSQKQFFKIVNNYTKSKCEYMKFDIWFNQLSKILGPENVLIYESEAINEKILTEITFFSGGSWPITSFTSERINKRHTDSNKWFIKPNKTFRNFIKSIAPIYNRGRLFKFFYRICLALDSMINLISLSDKYIILPNKEKEQIRRKFKDSNTNLLTLKRSYPQQILISEKNWEINTQ